MTAKKTWWPLMLTSKRSNTQWQYSFPLTFNPWSSTNSKFIPGYCR